MSFSVKRWALVPLALVLASGVAGAQERENFRLDREIEGRIGPKGEAKLYRFVAREPGIITLVGTAVIDIAILVLDDEGQIVYNGHIDRDFLGDLGKEYGLVVIPSRGEYAIEVRGVDSDEGGGAFSLMGSFLADPMFARSPDVDGKPSGAREIGVGQGLDDTVSPNGGDRIDWYTFEATEAGTYVIVTRGEASQRNDLLLQAFVGDALFDSPTESTDEDLRDNLANESVSLELKAGERVRFRVISQNERGDAMTYRVSVSLVP